jgi:hypothetical protein
MSDASLSYPISVQLLARDPFIRQNSNESLGTFPLVKDGNEKEFLMAFYCWGRGNTALNRFGYYAPKTASGGDNYELHFASRPCITNAVHNFRARDCWQSSRDTQRRNA